MTVADAEWVWAGLAAETVFGCRIRGANFSEAEKPPAGTGAEADLDVLPLEDAFWLVNAAEVDADADAGDGAGFVVSAAWACCSWDDDDPGAEENLMPP